MAKASGSINLNAMNDASKIATNCFATDNNGIMVYNGSNGTTDSTHVTTRNILITSTDVLIRNGTTTLAKYGESTQIGADNTGHINITSKGIQFYGSNGAVKITELKCDSAYYGGDIVDKPYISLGDSRDSVGTNGTYSTSSTYSIGDVCIYNGLKYVCNTEISTPESWVPSHWDFYIGGYSTTEGEHCLAAGVYSHAEGLRCKAIGYSSHAEGSWAYSVGDDSHAQNRYTIALGLAQTVIGKYNIPQGSSNAEVSDDYALIIGNGTSKTNRSNALTVDWEGNVSTSGGVTAKGLISTTGSITASGDIIGTVSKTTITSFTSGWTVYDSDSTVTLRKRGGVVTLTGGLKNTSAVTLNTSNTAVFTIPEGYRPSQRMAFITQGTGSNIFLVVIETNGTVEFSRYRDTGSSSANSYSSIAAGAWFPFHTTWIMD